MNFWCIILFVWFYCILSFSTHLGSGQFGTVSQGVWSSPKGPVDVAVKSLQPRSQEMDRIKFLQEAAINGQFQHPNVVKLLGVITIDEPVGRTHAVTSVFS